MLCVLIGIWCNAVTPPVLTCDYQAQWDPSFAKFYIYECQKGFKELKIGYGSFGSLEDASDKIRQIREQGGDNPIYFDVPR